MKTAIKMGLVIITLLVAVVSLRADFILSDVAWNTVLGASGQWDANTGILSTTGSSPTVYVYYAAAEQDLLTFNYSAENQTQFKYGVWPTGQPAPNWNDVSPTTLTGSGSVLNFLVPEDYSFGFYLNKNAGGQNRRGVTITGFNGTPVPEPSTYAMASGLVLIGFVAYRRFRQMPTAA